MIKNSTQRGSIEEEVVGVVCIIGIFVVSMAFIATHPRTEKIIKDRGDAPFSLQDGSYSGWQMGCNYSPGSDEWSQEKLDCANGIVYTRYAESPSRLYFDPRDDEKNDEVCHGDPAGDVAFFSGTGRFIECGNW